ncbi:PREDICTED: UDP-N-acetylglucosamine transferase subunit ALG13 homolog [Ceratosolen solmsi marchali]|uniref:UDP-N-acetylglucosamine transferase subunit ALG13 n=1 Tax=Ceratosolen solmsi marchali TaxID=326594 RepID=A0AAJ6YMY2_9HYME|nr:PREDICTED: UDP-N-acetylglucosamine transferase subunit ALG13 homolog [Ceratosolen solmsi marchali]XP_011501019.1 PREDICTED: UDP-N-acetylglucosamine transferase subunit ALG13 homolog [Ceratosolen solmsi marchali]
MNKRILVTVGTTKFDELINTITTNEVLQELNNQGYNELILQIGKTNFQPNCSSRCGFNNIKAFHLNSSLHEVMKSADLIISHAGAGSCLEALELLKPLIIIINDHLMSNHQLELAKQLYKLGYLYYSNCKGLLKLIQIVNLSKLKPYPGDKSKDIASIIDKIMGYSNF